MVSTGIRTIVSYDSGRTSARRSNPSSRNGLLRTYQSRAAPSAGVSRSQSRLASSSRVSSESPCACHRVEPRPRRPRRGRTAQRDRTWSRRSGPDRPRRGTPTGPWAAWAGPGRRAVRGCGGCRAAA
jgi:hypothetical protein